MKKFKKVLMAVFIMMILAYVVMGLITIQMLATNYSFVLGALATVMSVISIFTLMRLLTE